ncbi:hypothetical protein RCL1_003327 [Eukaryota sp. TZLM3-RCL]
MTDDLDSWIAEQIALAKLVTIPSEPVNVQLIGGFDVSFFPDDPSKGTGCLTVMKYPTLDIVYQDLFDFADFNIPYISGFLAFREFEIFKLLFNRLKNSSSRTVVVPDVFLIDGNGVLHQRRCGVASHIGVKLNLCTIGVSKNLLCIDGLREDIIKQRAHVQLSNAGDYFFLRDTSGNTLGAVLKPTSTVRNPIYVSVGNGISLEQALQLVSSVCKFRVPEPIRQADKLSRMRIAQRIT